MRSCDVKFSIMGDFDLGNRGISWATKDKIQQANYFGSLTQASSIRVGSYNGEEIYAPLQEPLSHGGLISSFLFVQSERKFYVLLLFF